MSSKITEIFRLQRVIALTVFLIGFSVSMINFIARIDDFGVLGSFLKPGSLTLFSTSVLFLLTYFVNRIWARGLQLILGFLTGALSILDSYNSIHGLGLFILFIIIAYKYGFFKKKTILKIIIMMLTIFTLIEIAIRTEYPQAPWNKSMDSILYLLFFFFILYNIYSNEIKAYISKTTKAESTVKDLLLERDNLSTKLTELNVKIEDLMAGSEPVDLDSMGITEREKEVIEALVVYRETEKDLALRLGIKYQTIKVHFKHIRNKLGVDRREEIIDMCRNNF